MHISIYQAQDLKNESGQTYTLYTIAINGATHCLVRYTQLTSLNDQLVKEFGVKALPAFPVKKIFSLSEIEKEERRNQLEIYFQKISQNLQILNSDILLNFFSSAQKEIEKDPEIEIEINIFLMNFEKVSLIVSSYDQTEDILRKLLQKLDLDLKFIYYFGLFLVKKDDTDTIQIVRQLQEFESPCLSLKEANKIEKHKLLLRKSTFDRSLNLKFFDDKIALNLLYIQAVAELEWGWIKPTDEQRKELEQLRNNNSKKKYLTLINTTDFYGYIHLKECVTNYPEQNTRVKISIGDNQIYFSFLDQKNKEKKELSLKITRIRCWKILSVKNDGTSSLEFSFEYLMKKDTFQWITLQSDQSIMLSMCLQSIVEEILMKKANYDFGDAKHRAVKLPFMTRQERKTNGKKLTAEKIEPTPEMNFGENTIFDDDNFISNDDL